MSASSSTVVIAVPPDAQPIDVSGPLSAFREANRQSNGKVNYDVRLLSTNRSSSIQIDGMKVSADVSINDPAFAIDTLLVAGTHNYQQAITMHAFQKWLKRRAPKARRYGSVCTGAFFLAAAGLLEGKRVTTHWQQVVVPPAIGSDGTTSSNSSTPPNE